MSILSVYRDYFDIDPEYFPAVNQAVINKNPDMWKKFFPHETFIKLLKNTVDVLNRKQKVSIWVEGAYGTGKSHAVLTLKKLLDATEEDTNEYFSKHNLDKDLFNKLQGIKNSGKILTVHRYGSSNIRDDNDLVIAIQESVEKALEDAGIENQGKESLREAVVRYLSDSENKQSFNVYLKGSYSNLFGGDDADSIIKKLGEYKGESYRELMDKIFKLARERQIRAFSMSANDLCQWLIEVIQANNLKAIVFIWDEFTEYFYNNSRNLTGFQELCELSETQPFYFVLVTHVSSGLFHEGDKDFIKINGRFINPHCLISLPENIAFQLMDAAMEKNKDEQISKDWEEIAGDLADRTKEARKIVQGIAKIGDKEMTGILPIHPYTALLLKHISAAFDSNQRSMFDFIKNDRGDEIKGFQWFIDNYGPGDDNPLLTVDMLWEFFYDKGRDLLTQDIRSILDYYRNFNQKLGPEEKRILKTVLLLQAISQHAGDAVELFVPNDKNIESAFEGSDLENGAVTLAMRLVNDKVLFKKQLGEKKFQYAAYVNEASGEELDKFKEEVDKKTTASLITETLKNKTAAVAESITLSGALKLRYELRHVTVTDFDQSIRLFRNREAELENKIPAVVCFAKDDTESVLIGKKIKEALNDENGGYRNIVFIDATTTPFGQDGYEQYRNEMAQALHQQGKDNTLSGQYVENAKDALKKWKDRIIAGEFKVYTDQKRDGERATTMEMLFSILANINKQRFPLCLEAAYNVIGDMYSPKYLKLGVECGATRKTRQVYSSSNPKTKLEEALKEAWNETSYWQSHPSLLISKIKIAVDGEINKAFTNGAGRISIRSIYDLLKTAPYGFMPCNLTAFVLGFVLREYVNGKYSYSDGLTNDVLNLEKLKEMVSDIIQLQITPNPRYKDKYIVAMTEEEKAFNATTSYAFGILEKYCTSVEQTRERVRNEMKKYGFPIWTLKSVLPTMDVKTDHGILENLIDCYCGIANSNNISKTKTDNDFANTIGELCIKNPDAKEDLKTLITKENCTVGMQSYLAEFEDGELIQLSSKVGDGGQYINVLRRKFDADAANWVWNVETAEQKIRETILEYKIIYESNNIISKCISFTDTVREWCEKCSLIRISYAAAKNYLGDIAPFIEMLHDVKKAGTLLDSQKQKFLALLVAHGNGFKQFYSNQLDVFKQACDFYLNGFTEEEVKGLFATIPSGVFTYEKSTYLNLIDTKAKEYRNTLGNVKLKKLWKDKTNSISPRAWSKEHKMPILALISDKDMQAAKDAFYAVNAKHPEAATVDKAIKFLEKATFYVQMQNPQELDRIFRENIIKSYTVMLSDIDEVKEYLFTHINSEPYDWYGLKEVDNRLKQLAEDKYFREGCDKALAKIDDMELDDVRRYLKELIKDNMIVGMEIIKKN